MFICQRTSRCDHQKGARLLRKMENMVGESIQSMIEKLHAAIEKLFKLNSEKREILRSNQKHLTKAFRKGAQPHLKSIENTVNKYIAIPRNVLLEEDKCQRIQYDDTEFESIKQRLENLQQRAKRATILNAILKEELAVLEQLPIPEENVNRMYNTIESDLRSSDINEALFQLVDDYKQFSTVLFGSTQLTEKIKYNTVNNLQCGDFDSSIL
ncbi:protein MIS12 homolog isoform X2 [Ceratina calcarata]|uniref:Protein MIS12 homolog isoform X2 n=1 Tax=Ceratina calcarata TaxID=156304 RepID=A0AAJ7WBP5_9HYME|nr:protein MIS12 homolog isoform X2 [Ceratina calcarata]